MLAKDRIIVALDFSDWDTAKNMVDELAPHVGYFKFGLEAITAPTIKTPKVIDHIHERGGKVFYDGKFNDIPNTVGQSVKNIVSMGVEMFNVHASCGIKAMRAVAEHKGTAIALAVSVLTSLEENNAHLIYGKPSKAAVLQFAREAALGKMDGIICSPLELKILSENPELDHLLRVTPGIRPAGSSKDDQARITTPGQAVGNGATYLVIGRPITKTTSPRIAATRIATEIETALQSIKEA
ncbi:orotidine-5'-phosphate decarboxylase [Patescibacteria group bacterium]